MKLIFKSIGSISRYRYPYNINSQQRLSYLTKINQAEKVLNENEAMNKIPRRKRRVYDRPKIQADITNYGAWRVFQQQEWLNKFHEHALQVLLKIQIAPKWLVHAFGRGSLPLSHNRSAHRQFMFQDNQLNAFLLYEYRNTTDFKPNKEDYDYQNQQNLHPRMRIKERISPQEFWNSQDEFQFRINGTQYAEKYKFKQWLLSQIERRKSLKNYDEYIDEKFTKTFTFNKIGENKFFEANKPMILNVTPEHYQPKKGKTPKLPQSLTWKKLDQKYRVQGEKSVQAKKVE